MSGPARMPLTPRQALVLHAAADGAPLAVVAARVGRTRQQVAARLSEAYERLGVAHLIRSEKRAAAVREARRRGLIPDPAPAAHDGPSISEAAAEDRAYWNSRYDQA